MPGRGAGMNEFDTGLGDDWEDFEELVDESAPGEATIGRNGDAASSFCQFPASTLPSGRSAFSRNSIRDS